MNVHFDSADITHIRAHSLRLRSKSSNHKFLMLRTFMMSMCKWHVSTLLTFRLERGADTPGTTAPMNFDR